MKAKKATRNYQVLSMTLRCKSSTFRHKNARREKDAKHSWKKDLES